MPEHPSKPLRFAAYARISRDRVGAGLGIERQLKDCAELAHQLGGTITLTLSDNDVSAMSGKRRPGYERLLEALKAGEIDAVVAWHQDRLLRRNIDLEGYITACEPLSIPTYTVKAGLLDLSTPAGRAVARTLAAWASYEVETGTTRVKASKLQAAQSGLTSGGNRAYGYRQSGMEFEPLERQHLLWMVDRLLAGDSYRTIALKLNERTIPTAKGNKWRAINVRNVIMNKRNIGIRVHNGMEYPAKWPRMFDDDLWAKLSAAMTARRAMYRQRGPGRVHLLKGFATCGLCGNTLVVSPALRSGGVYVPTYVCRRNDDAKGRVGCGGVKRVAAPLHDLVTDAVLYRLNSDNLAQLLQAGQADSRETKQLLIEHGAQQGRLTEIIELYSAGDITYKEYSSMKTMATVKLDDINHKLQAVASATALGSIPLGNDLRRAWETAGLNWKRQLLDQVIDRVVVHPRPSIKDYAPPRYKRWRFDPSLVTIEWRV